VPPTPAAIAAFSKAVVSAGMRTMPLGLYPVGGVAGSCKVMYLAWSPSARWLRDTIAEIGEVRAEVLAALVVAPTAAARVSGWTRIGW
jgi:hypothetical protein